jgi:hypothetical protein
VIIKWKEKTKYFMKIFKVSLDAQLDLDRDMNI